MSYLEIGEGLYFGDLFDQIFRDPIQDGATLLTAVVGYASASFTSQLLAENENVSLRLIIGMAKQSGISKADHYLYKELAEQFYGRFMPHYYVGAKPIHAKVYGWMIGSIPYIGYAGSPNFSWSAYHNQQEVAVKCRAQDAIELYAQVKKQSCTVFEADVSEEIKLVENNADNRYEQARTHGKRIAETTDFDRVTLSLLDSSGEVPPRSGLNWGQRNTRNRNQAYINIPSSTRTQKPGFFPPRKEWFVIKTDDGKAFYGVVAQDEGKAIQTPEGNHILGEYFRSRLGLEDGEFVRIEHLKLYGRTDVEFTKVDDELFLMDFSV